MRPDRHWLFLFAAVLVGVLIYALSPLLNVFHFFFRQGINLILAVPQLVWWLIGGAILTFWGLHLLVQLGKSGLPGVPEPQPARQSQGHLSELRKSLYEADSGIYSQDRIRQILSTLAIDLISLRLDISQEEARELYFRADWTEDEIVKAYFNEGKDTTAKNRSRLPRWFKKSQPSLFLKETGQILNRLDHYSHSPNGGKLGHPNDSD
ncbi:MAG: DUF7269 family protein [Thermodesulfobacteriota bacterium]